MFGKTRSKAPLTHTIEIEGISIEVKRKKIRSLRLTIHPPGSVRISVPLRAREEYIRRFVISKMEWIRRTQKKFASYPTPIKHEYLSGETHMLWGEPRVLRIVHEALPNDDHSVTIRVPHGASKTMRKQKLQAWYRKEMAAIVPPLIQKWEAIIDVSITRWTSRQMKTRWGSCNIRARRITLNLELAKMPKACLEYIIVHELVHLLERYHNKRFYSFMDRFMPEWRDYRTLLHRHSIGRED